MPGAQCTRSLVCGGAAKAAIDETDVGIGALYGAFGGVRATARLRLRYRNANEKRSRKAPSYPLKYLPKPYLILDSLNSTCLRATGSYFFLTSLSVMVREFFLVT